MSYGHGISVTLMQLARAYLAFARDGDLLPLSLTRLDPRRAAGQSVFSAQTAREVRAMLELAVQPGGTAPKAQIPGYRVAGKTGTAHKLEGGTYADKYVSSFVGFAPVSDPRLIVAVMIDEPSAGKYYGGDVAAPVFAQVMAGGLRTLGVAPDAPLQAAADGGRAGRKSGEPAQPRRYSMNSNGRAYRRQASAPTRARVRPGDVFVAMPGHRVDGRDFIAAAVARGAAAVLSERDQKVGAGETADHRSRRPRPASPATSPTWCMAVPRSGCGWPASPAPTARPRYRSGSPRP